MTAPVEIPGHRRILPDFWAANRHRWIQRCECGWTGDPFAETHEEHAALLIRDALARRFGGAS